MIRIPKIFFELDKVVPHKVVFKDFAYSLRIAYLRPDSLLFGTISVACVVSGKSHSAVKKNRIKKLYFVKNMIDQLYGHVTLTI